MCEKHLTSVLRLIRHNVRSGTRCRRKEQWLYAHIVLFVRLSQLDEAYSMYVSDNMGYCSCFVLLWIYDLITTSC